MQEELDRRFWRARAYNAIMRGLSALQSGEVPFEEWERLHLTAALDEFRVGNFERAAEWADRIMDIESNRRPFPGQFGQVKSLSSLQEEFEQLARLARDQDDRP
jgi:hypothetical protein